MRTCEAPRAMQLRQRSEVYEIKNPDMDIADRAQAKRGLRAGVIRPVVDKNAADYAMIGG